MSEPVLRPLSSSRIDRGAPLVVLLLILTVGSLLVTVEPAYTTTALFVFLAYLLAGDVWASQLSRTRWVPATHTSLWPENTAMGLVLFLLLAHGVCTAVGAPVGGWLSVVGMAVVTAVISPITLARFPGVLLVPLRELPSEPLRYQGAGVAVSTRAPRLPGHGGTAGAHPSPVGRTAKANLLRLNRELEVDLLHSLGRAEEAAALEPIEQVISRLDARRRARQRKYLNRRRMRRRPSKRQGARIVRRSASRRTGRVYDPDYDPAAKRDDEDNEWTDLDNISDSQVITNARRSSGTTAP
ncbi:hypothetical protein [Planctomonas deserti]|uniref:hypothetical protein n=1 Tax=Planctomonas deserti TaxID=2144185 RepID=UPI00131ED559|nr:hypothetical protein [Planctomonas deserti]